MGKITNTASAMMEVNASAVALTPSTRLVRASSVAGCFTGQVRSRDPVKYAG